MSIDPTKTPDEIVEDIEAAEEAKDIEQIVAFISMVASNETAGEEDWAEVAEAALDALYRLIKGGDPNQKAIGYLKTVFDCLNAWEEEEAIVEVGLGCLVAIASKADKEAEESTQINVEFVLDLMKDYESESTIQEQACLAIRGLALCKSAWKEKLASAEGIQEELLAAKNERITNERNKKYPLQAAEALGIQLE